MNREIKFHAWNKKINKMVDLRKLTPLATEFPGLFLPFSDDIVLMQYIGIKDKAEKEIYEGDIVKCPLSNESTAYLWQEAMEKGYENFVIRVIAIPDIYREGIPEDCEIIGNIYENEDLLKD